LTPSQRLFLRVNLVMAHLTVDRMDPSAAASGRPVDLRVQCRRRSSGRANYVALGPPAPPTAEAAPCPCTTAGSAAVDFGEQDNPAGLPVEASNGVQARPRTSPITAGRRLSTVAGRWQESQRWTTRGWRLLRGWVREKAVPGMRGRGLRGLRPTRWRGASNRSCGWSPGPASVGPGGATPGELFAE